VPEAERAERDREQDAGERDRPGRAKHRAIELGPKGSAGARNDCDGEGEGEGEQSNRHEQVSEASDAVHSPARPGARLGTILLWFNAPRRPRRPVQE
jgi:hypothetical protein